MHNAFKIQYHSAIELFTAYVAQQKTQYGESIPPSVLSAIGDLIRVKLDAHIALTYKYCSCGYSTAYSAMGIMQKVVSPETGLPKNLGIAEVGLIRDPVYDELNEPVIDQLMRCGGERMPSAWTAVYDHVIIFLYDNTHIPQLPTVQFLINSLKKSWITK